MTLILMHSLKDDHLLRTVHRRRPTCVCLWNLPVITHTVKESFRSTSPLPTPWAISDYGILLKPMIPHQVSKTYPVNSVQTLIIMAEISSLVGVIV